MDIYLVNFATTKEDIGFPDHSHMQRRLNSSAKKFGIQNIISWNRQKLAEEQFFYQNSTILDQKKGAGFWLWKPYIIYKSLLEIPNDAILVYLDSDIELLAPIDPLIPLCLDNNGFFLIGEKHLINKHWIKRDVFHYMDMDEPMYHDAYMTPGGLQIYQKNGEVLEFLEELLYWSTFNRSMLTDEPNNCGKQNLEGFIEHRHDQSVLTLLRINHNLPTFRWPTQYGNQYKAPIYRKAGEFLTMPYRNDFFRNSPYGTLMNHGKHSGRIKNLYQYIRFKLIPRLISEEHK